MNYGIAPLSLASMRLKPSDKSEQVNQLLFGEAFEILELEKQWQKIKLSHDGYEGWIDEKQIQPLTTDQYQDYQSMPLVLVDELTATVGYTGGLNPVVLGSVLPFWQSPHLQIGERTYSYKERVILTNAAQLPSYLLKTAYQYLNAPYHWGGRSPFGIDCSGLTQMIFRFSGIPLPRDAYQQEEQGLEVNDLVAAQAGDLAFFKNEEGRIIHVGLLLSSQEILHAHGKVRIDWIDDEGIQNVDTRKYTHQLHSIKRIVIREDKGHLA